MSLFWKEKGRKRTLRRGETHVAQRIIILELFFFRRYFFSEKRNSGKRNLFYPRWSLPPMYGLRASGMVTVPSDCRWFSRKAMSILGGATTVLLRVWAK